MHMVKRITISLILLFNGVAIAQFIPKLDDGYYCVVGTFRITNNALAYRQSLAARGFSACIGKDLTTGLHYVHLGKVPTKEGAAANALALRQNGGFKDAWVKIVGMEEIIALGDSTRYGNSQDSKLYDNETQLEKQPTEVQAIGVSNTEVFLHLYNPTNDKMIDGTVEIVDTERSRLIEIAKGNNYYLLPDPKSKTNRITMIGNAFGYRKVQNEISYPMAEADGVNPNIEMVGTITMVRFDMVRYIKGDINVLYNVYFYNDASVMEPESKYELNKLLDMLHENDDYRIRLHGHSNGNKRGKIISPGDGKDLFSLSGATESYGTAKELAARRAQVIKEFLVANGIAQDRIELKAWGGQRPLYDKNSPNAKRNLRVEIEILAD